MSNIISFEGSSSLAPIISSIGNKFMGEASEKISISVSASGSGAGLKSVLDNKANFGMLSRKIKDSEKSKMSNYKEYIVVSDALTISVNAKNPIVKVKDNLDINTIKKIFSGEYKYWSDVDSSLPQKEIAVIVRDSESGAYDVFQEAVMSDSKISSSAIKTSSMKELCSKISENENAIGYASYGLYNQNKDKLFALKVDGIEASKENILNGKYKIQRPLMLIKNSDVSEIENSFINYIFSDAGKKIIEENGYIPVK